MFSVEVNSTSVRLKLAAMPENIHSAVRLTAGTLAEKLRSHIVKDKLRGQVLHRRTGLLGDNEFYRIDETASSITGTVFVGKNVPYAAIHEYGAVFQRLVTMVWGRHVKNPKNATFHYPERSYQRTGLADMRQEIVNSLQETVIKASRI